jgi:hypothetical protein
MVPSARSGLLFVVLVAAGCSSSRSATPEIASPSALPSAAASAGPTGSAVPAAETPAPKQAENVKTLFVKPDLVDCEGEGPMKCMVVREGGAAGYELFYSRIDGFQHEAGYQYELKVELVATTPPAPGARVRYRLLEIVSKDKVR